MWFAEPPIPRGKAKPLKMGVGKRKGRTHPAAHNYICKRSEGPGERKGPGKN